MTLIPNSTRPFLYKPVAMGLATRCGLHQISLYPSANDSRPNTLMPPPESFLDISERVNLWWNVYMVIFLATATAVSMLIAFWSRLTVKQHGIRAYHHRLLMKYGVVSPINTLSASQRLTKSIILFRTSPRHSQFHFHA